jgi:FixJ family two-component response regulator
VDFLSKPFDDAELLGAAGQALERDRKRWEARQRVDGSA